MPPTTIKNMLKMTVRELFSANAVIPFMFDSSNVRGDKDYANVAKFFLRTVTFWPFKGSAIPVQGLCTNL
jgi:hypothetical protein